ncbi:hypothetical protein S40285_09418 [Stachybotrys chlorohalonatus IBT 40285]|uniref:Phosphatidylinositol-specific phospholipase C X domain-containing protein n=1 Tax=Stachybotrys chlorohalonatus (strain IBT 40285) TaxID=1283841 RepID=A0A084R213_STAC4|nr:hypothetical protein S40285_09418 [Stachybotrys chlorohalonata IBT 40285]
MLIVRFLVITYCALLAQASCYRGYSSEFSFNAGGRIHADWIGNLADGTFLTSLSIPGTHDTMTYDIHDQVWQCQNRNLSVQLNPGLRYFDIRGRLVNNLLDIYHSTTYTGYSYEDVLLDFFDFLTAHPSEIIVMRLKQESTSINTTISYEDAFLHYLWNNSATATRAQKHLHLPPEGQAYAPLPTLGELRGKIVLLQNFPSNVPNCYGIGWESSDMILQDMWEIENVDSLWRKWDAIEASLETTALSAENNSALFLSYLSASVGLLPIEALNHTIMGMNDRTGQWLTDVAQGGHASYGKTGIVIADSPGQDLMDAVLDRNAPFYTS